MSPKRRILLFFIAVVLLASVLGILYFMYSKPVRQLKAYMMAESYSKAVAVYNNELADRKISSKESISCFEDAIQQIASEGESNLDSVQEAMDQLQILKTVSHAGVSQMADDKMESVALAGINGFLNQDDYARATSLYNYCAENGVQTSQILQLFINRTEEIEKAFLSGNLNYEDAIKMLQAMMFCADGDVQGTVQGVTLRIAKLQVGKYVELGEYEEAVRLYNTFAECGIEKDESLTATLDREISSIELSWNEGVLTFYEADTKLAAFQQICNSIICLNAEYAINRITIENSGSIALEKAEKQFSQAKYIECLKTLSTIDTLYSQYAAVEDLNETCRKVFLISISHPETAEEYEKYIAQAKEVEFLQVSSITARITELEIEYDDYQTVCKTINKVAKLYAQGSYTRAFNNIAAGLKKYPDNPYLLDTEKAFHELYIIDVTRDVTEKISEKDWKSAISIIDKAKKIYPCEEFDALGSGIEANKNIISRITTSIRNKVLAIVTGWKEDEHPVQRAASDAGAYIYKSGKKIALGDYTDDNITVLSFAGNIVLGLANLDLLFDIRDLSYDLTHWGEDDYFLLYLAADTIALVPVIGMVKYLKHADDVAEVVVDSAKYADDVVEVVTDTGKHIDDVAEILSDAAKYLDNTSDVAKRIDEAVDIAKQSDNAGDAVHELMKAAGNAEELATETAKHGDEAAEIAQESAKHFEHVKTRNEALVGKRHPKTGVLFQKTQLELSDGRKLEGVFPVFDTKAEIQLPERLYKSTFEEQQKYLNEELKKLCDTKNGNPNVRKLFTEDELNDIMNGIIPEGYTWHHNEKEGLMQLVDSVTHAETGHDGGMAIWGRGY